MITDEKIRRCVAVLYCTIILGLAVWFLISPKKDFSENENRYLASMPVLSAKNVLSGDYMDDMSDWLSDQFPMRDFFMGFKTSVEIGTGRRKINGVYIAQDGYLIEAYEQPTGTDRISSTLARFYEKTDTSRIDARLMLVPTAVTVCQEKLPAFAPAGGQLDTAHKICDGSGIPYIDCSGQLFDAAGTGQLYYRTDHHWTTFGAYQGYLAYCAAKGLEPVPLGTGTSDPSDADDGLFLAQTVTDGFAGTLYSKVNDRSLKKDEITIYTHPADRLKVTYTDTGVVTDTLYNLDYLDEKDKYSLFLDNIHTLVMIENETAVSDNVLVLIKDSYANSMVPFLAHHYRRIYVFDTRYYKKGPSSFLAEHPEVTDLLILYNMNTIDTDSGIRGIF